VGGAQKLWMLKKAVGLGVGLTPKTFLLQRVATLHWVALL